jgi:hypothetical protein
MWTDLILAILALLPLFFAKTDRQPELDAVAQGPCEPPMLTALALEAAPAIPLRQSPEA